VLIDAKSSIRKQIVRELQIMHECESDYIIECYGSYLADPNICICMEYMDRGSFDSIYKKIGPIQVEVVARVAMSVLEGLTYLYDVHRIIHRGACFVSLTWTVLTWVAWGRHQAFEYSV
jgi:mitogen-activated protein kinase kinase